MPRKITSGPFRNKERTKKRIINSVGEIIEKEGFWNIRISKIAIYAKCDKKLIYQYFGGTDELIKEYFNARNLLGPTPKEIANIEKNVNLNSGKDMAYQFLENQFDSLMDSGEMRGVIAWELSQKLALLTQQTQKREKLMQEIFNKITINHGKDKNTRVIEAILMGGISYLILHTYMNQSTFCGIDLKKNQGQQEIKNAIKQILEWAYS